MGFAWILKLSQGLVPHDASSPFSIQFSNGFSTLNKIFFWGTINFCHENPIQITGHLRLRSFCVFPPPPSICRCHTAASITSKVGDFDQTSSSSECALLLASNSSQFGANIWSNVANLNVKTALKPTWWPHDLRFSSSKDVPPSHDDTS